MNIQIENATKNDRDELYNFYLFTITDTFYRNGIEDPVDLKKEVLHQLKTFNNRYDILMVARTEGKIIGTIAFGKMNKSVSSNIPENLLDLKEIKGVYVHPDFQGMGIGTKLWTTMLTHLTSININKVCLDSGYKISQQYWEKKIGEPTFFMKDYWGKGEHQLIWVFNINDIT